MARLTAPAAILVVGIFGAVFTAHAATTDFTDPAAFAAATTKATTIGFNGILPAGVSFQNFNPLIVSGVTFSTPTAATFVNVTTPTFYSPNNYPAAFIVDSANPSSSNELIISFSKPTFALALVYGGLGLTGVGSGTFTLSNGHVFTNPSLPTVGHTAFVGFVSTDPITALTFVTSNDSWIVENLVVANTFVSLAEQAAALARTLLGVPYGWEGKGYDFSKKSYVEQQDIAVNGYTYPTADCGTTDHPRTVIGVGVDCSGLVVWAYNTAAGVTTQPKIFQDSNPIRLPNADAQYRFNTIDVPLSPSGEPDLQPGDLLFFDYAQMFVTIRNTKIPLIDHVAMFVGGDDVVESPDCGLLVQISSKQELAGRKGFIGFRRVGTPHIDASIRVASPVSLAVTDPDGFAINASTFILTQREMLREIPGILYYLVDTNQDDTVLVPTLKTGPYLINVVPKPGAPSSATYLLEFATGNRVLTLAANVAIASIPPEGYAIQAVGGQVSTLVPFSSFTVHGEVDPTSRDFNVRGRFTLGSRSVGINPATQDVTLRIGTFNVTLPAGTLKQNERGRFSFEGVIQGVKLEAEIRLPGRKQGSFRVEAENANLNGTRTPVRVALIVGSNGGSTDLVGELD